MRKYIALIILLYPLISSAEELFQKCDNLKSEKSYAALFQYFDQADKVKYSCQRLDNSHYLYTDDDNLNYCERSDGGKFECVPHLNYSRFPYISKIKEFSGSKGKKFVLLKTFSLSRGVYSEGYSAFYFVPKTVEPRGYKVLSLKEASISNGTPSDAGEACSNLPESWDAKIQEEKDIIVTDEFSDRPRIGFRRKVISCKTKNESYEEIIFRWEPEKFLFEKHS